MPVRDLSPQRLQDLSNRLAQGAAQRQRSVEQLAAKLNDLPAHDALQATLAQVARLSGVRIGFAAFESAHDLPFRPIPISSDAEPERYVVIASDGSQILPEPQDPAAVAYLQVGCVATAHGVERAADLVSAVQNLSWAEWRVDSELVDADSGERLTAAQLNARRDLAERRILVEACAVAAQHQALPLALIDGTLLPFVLLGNQTLDRALLHDFTQTLDALQACGAVVCGYVDSPQGSFLVHTCALADLPAERVTEQNVRARLEQARAVSDLDLMKLFLPPAHRTPLFTPSWRINTATALKQHRVRACYVNLALPGGSPAIARLELPAWCAGAAQVDRLCAALLRQARVGDAQARGYPFILRLAHARVVVRQSEARAMKRVLTQIAQQSGAATPPSPKARFKLRR